MRGGGHRTVRQARAAGRHTRIETQIRADAFRTRRWHSIDVAPVVPPNRSRLAAICAFCVNRLVSAFHISFRHAVGSRRVRDAIPTFAPSRETGPITCLIPSPTDNDLQTKAGSSALPGEPCQERRPADSIYSPGLTRHRCRRTVGLAPHGCPGTRRWAGSGRLVPFNFNVRQPSPLCRRPRKPMW
jgi:hypothetical protein